MSEKKGTGILVGRFQVYDLNPFHRKLIDHLRQRHEMVLVYLGSNPAPSDANPLEWPLRADMFLSAYGEEIGIYEMGDLPDDRIWSQELDRRIMGLGVKEPVVLYGTQGGLKDRYSGRYPCAVLETPEKDLPDPLDIASINDLVSFRAGVIYGTLRRFPTVYPTVDIAVFDPLYQKVLLARKANETRYRFPGGFSDPSDDSFEQAALRELGEECGDLVVDDLTYIGSCRIRDWRYLDSMDGIITHLYTCTLVEGDPEPNDDIAELQWFDADKLRAGLFVPEHQPLFEMLKTLLDEEDPEEF